MSDEFNIPGMIYILYAVQLKKIIASTNIEKTVQEYNDPDLELELLGRTNDPDKAKEVAMDYASKVRMYGTPHGKLGDTRDSDKPISLN